MSFSTKRPLRFGDCDPSGIAYFPSYLNILVDVLEEFFATLGFPWSELIAERKIGTPTVTLDLEFLRPGLHGMALEFTLQVRAVGRASLDLDHTVASGGETLWTAKQRLVATSLDTHRSCPWPHDLRAALLAQVEAPVEGGAA